MYTRSGTALYGVQADEIYYYRYTLDVATEFLLGGSVDSLGNPQVQFAESFAEIQRTQMLLARLGFVIFDSSSSPTLP